MTGAPWWTWIAQVSGWTLAGVGLLVLLWALLWDRSRGRRRCPKCWYDMAGLSGLVCPECGRDARRERRLFRTRRRWRWMPLAVVLLIASYPVLHAHRIASAGWRGAVPTTGLIYWVATYEPAEIYASGKMSNPTSAATELARRASLGELWGWQWRLLLKRARIIRWRDRWPVGVPWRVSLNVPSWLQGGVKVTLPEHLSYPRLYPRDPEVHTREVSAIGLPITTQPLPVGANCVMVDVSAGGWNGVVRLPVRQVASVEDAITSVRDPAMDQAVRRALQPGITRAKNAATLTDLMLGARLYREYGPVPADIAVGITVELRRDGEVVKSWPLGMYDSAFGSPVDWIRITMPEPGWGTGSEEMGRWTVVVRGDPAVAIGDMLRDRCWAGEYTVPLSEFLQ